MYWLTNAVYLTLLLNNLYVTSFKLKFDPNDKDVPQGVKDFDALTMRFITVWNFVFQIIYLILILGYEILRYNNKLSLKTIEQFAKIRGFLVYSILIPSAGMVAYVFWMTYSLNPFNVLYVGMRETVPNFNWMNHTTHTFIVILPIVELFFHNLYVPADWICLTVYSVYNNLYNFTLVFTYFEKGKWLYPLFDSLNWSQTFAIILLGWIVGFLSCTFGLYVNKLKLEKLEKCKIALNNNYMTQSEILNGTANGIKKYL